MVSPLARPLRLKLASDDQFIPVRGYDRRTVGLSDCRPRAAIHHRVAVQAERGRASVAIPDAPGAIDRKPGGIVGAFDAHPVGLPQRIAGQECQGESSERAGHISGISPLRATGEGFT